MLEQNNQTGIKKDQSIRNCSKDSTRNSSKKFEVLHDFRSGHFKEFNQSFLQRCLQKFLRISFKIVVQVFFKSVLGCKSLESRYQFTFSLKISPRIPSEIILKMHSKQESMTGFQKKSSKNLSRYSYENVSSEFQSLFFSELLGIILTITGRQF